MDEKPLIIALDFPARENVFHFLKEFEGEKLFVKVGMELFYKEGARVVYELKEAGHDVFLDLKLHDIPVTVNRAMAQLAGLGADIVNVHALGGKAMMQAALEGLDKGTTAGRERPVCLAVTQLTSTSENVAAKEMGIAMPLTDHVLHLSRQAEEAGIDGVVCSAQEVPLISKGHPSLMTITPGIRLTGDKPGDQARVMTPSQARKNGSTGIVVGRGITRAENPFEAYKLYEKDWRQK